MARRRTGALLAALVLGVCALCLRLYQVQVGQYEVWANEAANLVRSSRVVPYERGRILDADGNVLARDRAAYHLVFRYRDFRREHLLGQVAHAWSALLGRPVSLEEAFESLEPWAVELAHLSPSDLLAFGRGAGLDTWRYTIAPRDRERDETDPDWEPLEARQRRASDVLYYVSHLLGLERLERVRLARALRKEEALPSFAETLAEWRGVTQHDVLSELSGRLDQSKRALARLEELLFEGPEFEAADGGLLGLPGTALVSLLEARRRGVEDAIADRLFLDTAGFAAGRLPADLLGTRIELSWLKRDLYWDAARLADWTRHAQDLWRRDWRDGFAFERVLVEIQAQRKWEEHPGRTLSLLLALFEPSGDFRAALDGNPRAWTEVRDLAVFERLDSAFEEDGDRDEEDWRARALHVLPVLEARLAEGVYEPEELWSYLEASTDRLEPAAEPMQNLLARNRLRGGSTSRRLLRDRLRELAGELVASWQRRIHERLVQAFDELAGPGGVLHLDRDRLKRRNRQHWVKDYGSRPLTIALRPEYDVVYLLTRHADEYRGFGVRDARTRVYLPPDAEPGAPEGELELPAAKLIGHVSRVDAQDIQEQRALRKNVLELRRNARRSEEETDQLRDWVAGMRLTDEVKGVAGIEAAWDEELRGQNGYREYLSLEDIYGEGRGEDLLRPPRNGADIQLTLVTPVQRAAEAVLAAPRRPPPAADGEVDKDAMRESWFDHPVGAIVLLDMQGDVIAAASHAMEARPGAVNEWDPRTLDIDRTLRKPSFQPPGSVFKPFVAAWALEHRALDPAATAACLPGEDGHAGHKGMRCWKRWGHGEEVDLRHALLGSCNAYFAWLGEQLDVHAFRSIADEFGFGHPTGVRGPLERAGLTEDYVPRLFGEGSLSPGLLMRAGNGLAVVEATPMQLGRAMIGLASGRMHPLRLVQRIGGEEVPREPWRPVAISETNLNLVREAMFGVANEREGTAFRALDEDLLGIGCAVAVKTGSADLHARSEEGSGGKDAWVGGWLPAEDPRAVFVVFLDTTDFTSSHSAVYVARQFLQEPAVRAWLAEQLQ